MIIISINQLINYQGLSCTFSNKFCGSVVISSFGYAMKVFVAYIIVFCWVSKANFIFIPVLVHIEIRIFTVERDKEVVDARTLNDTTARNFQRIFLCRLVNV